MYYYYHARTGTYFLWHLRCIRLLSVIGSDDLKGSERVVQSVPHFSEHCRSIKILFKNASSYRDALRIEAIMTHNTNKNTPLNLCLTNLSEEELNKMTTFYNTTYFCANEEIASTKIENLCCKLQIKYGIMCGVNYLNDKCKRMFLHHIPQVIKVNLLLNFKTSDFYACWQHKSEHCRRRRSISSLLGMHIKSDS